MAEGGAGVRGWLKARLGGLGGGGGDSSSLLLNSQGAVDAKTPIKVAKWAQKVQALVQNKRLNLKNSPPYLQGILVDTQDLINTIFRKQTPEDLKDNEVLNIFVAKFTQQCKKTLKLFKDAKETMEVETSDARRDLTKLTLVFSHMLTELKTFFKDGVWTPEFKIVKYEAREFWERHFGKRVIVTWDDWLAKFSEEHRIGSEEAKALQKTVDLMENKHVSWFEFDIFTRLFQPWKNIKNNWNVIVMRHPGFKAFMTYDEVDAILQAFKHKPGSYVFRLSCTRLGQWAIGFVTPNHAIVQTIPQTKSLYQALIDGMEDGTYIYPAGQDVNPDIRQEIHVAPEEHIKVTREQFELYCDIDSTFEVCKICDTRLKSIRIDPCGHLLCKACLSHWMETGGNRKGETACPFCREKVMSTESIVIDPFDPDNAPDSDYEDEEEFNLPMVSVKPRTASQRQRSKDKRTGEEPGFNTRAPASIAPGAAAAVAPPPSLPDRAYQGGPTRTSSNASQRSSGSSSNSSAPSRQPSVHSSSGSEDKILTLEAMGFQRDKILNALRIAKDDLAVATDILLSFGN